MESIQRVIDEIRDRRGHQIRDRIRGTYLEGMSDAAIARLADESLFLDCNLENDDDWREFLFVIFSNSY